MPLIERGGCSSFFVDGATYEIAAEVSIKLGGIVRKPVVSSNGVAGFTTTYEAPSIEVEIIDGPSVSISALKAISGSTLQVSLNNGKSYLLTNATQVDDPDGKIAEGKISGVKFTGSICKEVLVTS
jgi:hypothetical protein